MYLDLGNGTKNSAQEPYLLNDKAQVELDEPDTAGPHKPTAGDNFEGDGGGLAS